MRTAKTIAILVDCDMDGFTSSAILANYLEMQRLYGEQGENQTWNGNIPEMKFLFHEGKTHGLSDTDIMKQLRDLIKPALLIVPDASGTKEQYDALNELGIDIVVLDHHDMDERGDGDKVIVVNNQQSEKYKNKFLSGAGVVWQLCRVFDDMFMLACAEKYLDLVAVGLVADVMDLRSDETRFLVLEGLKPENIHNPFLKQCLFSNDHKLKGYFTPTKIGFQVGPMFNAVSRISPIAESELVFRALLDSSEGTTVESGKRGEKGLQVPLTAEAYRVASNARGRQNTRKTKVTNLIDQVINEEKLFENKIIAVALNKGDFEESYRGLSGLICNELLDYYNRPILLFFENEYGTYTGSARAPSSIEAFQGFREQCEESKLFTFAQGHSQAHGVGIIPANFDKMVAYFNKKYESIDMTETFFVDFYLDAKDEEAAEIIFNLCQYENCWGQGIAEPTIAFKNVLISRGSTQLVGVQKGKPTLKFRLENGVECIKFGSSQEEYDSLMLPYDDVEQCFSATIVGRADVNEYMGRYTPQLLIESYEIGEVEYVF